MIHYYLFVVLIIKYMVIFHFFGFSINTFIDGGNIERKDEHGHEAKGM